MKRLLHSFLKTFGYRIVRIEDGPRASDGLKYFFSSLQRLGFAPKHILDVGANRGLWTREALKYFPAARYTLIEPQDNLKSHVQDLLTRGSQFEWINVGAADKPGSLPMCISSRDDSSTFVLADRHGHSAGSNFTTVQAKSLDEIVSSVGIPDLVKIDAEGFDLKVLQGASSLFGKTDIFLAEAEVCGNYDNSVVEILNFMSAAGYRLLDITDLNRSPKHGVLWLVELAFLRVGSPLLNAVTSYE